MRAPAPAEEKMAMPLQSALWPVQPANPRDRGTRLKRTAKVSWTTREVPAARPSSPSVRFTPFMVPKSTNRAKGM